MVSGAKPNVCDAPWFEGAGLEVSPLAGELSTCPLLTTEVGLLPLPGEAAPRGDPEGLSTRLDIRLSRSVRLLALEGTGSAT